MSTISQISEHRPSGARRILRSRRSLEKNKESGGGRRESIDSSETCINGVALPPDDASTSGRLSMSLSSDDQPKGESACTVRIVAIGDLAVGKTSILLRFIEDRYITDYQPTVGVDFLQKSIGCTRIPVNVMMIDTAGQERYHALTNSFYRSAAGFMVVFDLSRHESFLNVRRWVKLARDAASSSSVPSLLIGNKCDLSDGERVVSKSQATELAASLGMPYVEASAATGEGIIDSVMWLVNSFIKTSDLALEAVKQTVTAGQGDGDGRGKEQAQSKCSC